MDNSNGVIVEIQDMNGLSIIKLVRDSDDFKFKTPSNSEIFNGAGNQLASGWNFIGLSLTW